MYREEKSVWSKHWDFVLLDIVCLQVAFLISYLIRHGWQDPYEISIYRTISILIILFDLCVVFFTEAYSGVLRRGYFVEYKCVIKHVTTIILLCFAYMFFVQNSEEFSRIVFLEMWGFSIILSYAARIVYKRVVKKRIKNGGSKREVILVADAASAQIILEDINRIEYRDFKITGIILAGGGKVNQVLNVPVLVGIDQGLTYLRKNVADEVLVYLSKELSISEIFLEGCIAMGITVHLNLNLMSQLSGEKAVEMFAGQTVLTASIKFTSPKQVFYKRMLDIIGGIAGVFITGILFIFVAPVIMTQSPGPIFFSQMRIGKNGRKFKLYKFRSMYTDAEERKKELMSKNEVKGLMFKIKDDPRIFPFGKFIRKTSIDEFPQFWNVLKGEMSLVGTRPPTVDEYEQYEQHHKKRLAIKPGITGLWQVSGRSQIKDFEEVVRLDEKYIVNWTFAADLRIILKTMLVVLKNRGAE